MSDRDCLIRPSLGSGMETDAEIGTSPFGSRIIWPAGGDSYLHASDASSSWGFPRLDRAFVSQGTEVTLDLSSLNYLEIKRLSRDITTTDHPQRTVYTCHGREVYDSQVGADPEHLFAVLLTRSRILDLEPGLYRRRAATRQLEILRASGHPLERDDYTDDDLYLIWTLDPRFDQGSSLARTLRLLGWLQPDGQMLGVARCWALCPLASDTDSSRADIRSTRIEVVLDLSTPKGMHTVTISRLDDVDSITVTTPEGTGVLSVCGGSVRRRNGLSSSVRRSIREAQVALSTSPASEVLGHINAVYRQSGGSL